jgi:hypothetical protein
MLVMQVLFSQRQGGSFARGRRREAKGKFTLAESILRILKKELILVQRAEL